MKLLNKIFKKNKGGGGAWVAQLLERLSLDSGSGPDLGVIRSSCSARSTLGLASAYPSPSAAILCVGLRTRSRSLSLSQINQGVQ